MTIIKLHYTEIGYCIVAFARCHFKVVLDPSFVSQTAYFVSFPKYVCHWYFYEVGNIH